MNTYQIHTKNDKTRTQVCSREGVKGIILNELSRDANVLFRAFPISSDNVDVFIVARKNLIRVPSENSGGFFRPKKKDDDEVNLNLHRGIDY